MFDIIGKRRWFFALSLIITIPGLLFIIGGFINPKVGLQFAIDFTGGTVWTIRFEDPAVTPDQVREVLAGQGIEANVTQTGQGFMEIRTKEAALAAPAPTPTPIPSASAGASGLAGRVGIGRRVRRRRPARRRLGLARRVRLARASASPAPSGSAAPSASAGAVAATSQRRRRRRAAPCPRRASWARPGSRSRPRWARSPSSSRCRRSAPSSRATSSPRRWC